MQQPSFSPSIVKSTLACFSMFAIALAVFGVLVATMQPTQYRISAFCGKLCFGRVFVHCSLRVSGIPLGSPTLAMFVAVCMNTSGV